MRIISGSAKGRKLKSPKDQLTRPTSDRLKETLFNILAPKIYGAHILDVFAGSGALGLEAISRGAASVTFFEIHKEAVRLIQDNVELCGFQKQSRLIVGDAISKIKTFFPGVDQKIDLVFIDPPYQTGLAEHALEVLSKVSWLKPTVTIVVEHHGKEELPDEISSLKKYRVLKQRDSTITFYGRSEEGVTE